MPISLKKVVGGSASEGIKLDGAQPANYFALASTSIYGFPVNIAGINISGSLTEMCSVDVPAGKKILLLLSTLSGLTTTAQPTNIEIEIDGVTVITNGGANTNSNILYLVGSSLSDQNVHTLRNLVVESNFKIRAQKAAGTSVTLQVSYIVVEG